MVHVPGSASGRRRHRYGFFSLAWRFPLENGATPEFRPRSLFRPFFFFFIVAARDRSEEISRARLNPTTFCRRIFAFLSLCDTDGWLDAGGDVGDGCGDDARALEAFVGERHVAL